MKNNLKALFSKPMGFTKIDRKIISFCEKNITTVFVFVITAIGLYMRYRMLPFAHSDLTEYFVVWYDGLKEAGGLLGLKSYSGDYNYPFPTMLAFLTYLPIEKTIAIKGLSIFFDIVLAIISGLIAKEVYKTNDEDGNKCFILAYSFTFLSPLVMLNSAYWGQNDSIYVSIVLISIYLILKDKYFWSLFVYGIAFSVKLQALLIFPLFVLIYLLNKKFSILYFFSIALGFIFSSFPGMIISGEGINGCLRIYAEEIGEERFLVQNFPNVYYWISAKHYDLYKVLGICFTIFIFIIVAYYLYQKKTSLNKDAIISLGIWVALTSVYFLPKMHERYGMMAEVLLLIWILGHKKWGVYAVIVNTITLFCYFAVLHGYYLYYFQNMAIVNIIGYVFFSYFVIMSYPKSQSIKEGS